MTASSSPPVGSISEQHWPLLDLIRFGAALLVLFGHARGLLFEGMARVEHPNALVRAFYLVSGLQHEGVVLFFVVSGFLVGGSVWRAVDAGRFNFRIYLTNRFARIYLVLVPALVLVLVLDVLGKSFLLDTRFYGVRPLWPVAVLGGWKWSQVPCHLLAVQGVFCEPWGADPPLWSLGYEWMLYLVAPAIFATLLVPMQRPYRAASIALALAGFAALTWWNRDWPIWFAFWMLGVAASQLFATFRIGRASAIGSLAICAFGLALSRLAIVPPLAADAAVGLGVAIAVSSPALMKWTAGMRIIARGAGFSYSLYLIHLPVCVFVGALLERWAGWPPHVVQPDAAGFAAFTVIVAVALCAAYAFARCTEDHTAAFRSWLMGLNPTSGWQQPRATKSPRA
jgi:peptidoglycan/LPS O-acetylase OafA/YrhL